MAERVEYIKISKLDQNNNDITNSLQALTQITIPYSNGNNVVYNVQNITKYSDYFLYTVGISQDDPDQNDSGSVFYQFTGSMDTGNVTSLSSPVQIPISESIIDNLNFFNLIEGTYNIDTLPQKDVIAQIQGDLVLSGDASDSIQVGVYKLQPGITNDTDVIAGVITSQTFSANAGATSINQTITITSQSISPGDQLSIRARKTAGSGGAFNVQFTSGEFRVRSTFESGPTLNTIPEPYLTSQFYGGDCDILLNNVELYRENPFLQDLDYSTNPFVPVNFSLILSGSAARGTVPLSNYTSLKSANPRYNGCKNQSENVNFYPPNGQSFPIGNDFLAPSQFNGIVSNNRISSIFGNGEPAVVTGTNVGIFGGFTVNSIPSDYFKVIDGNNFPSWGTGTMTKQKMLELNADQLNALTKDYSNLKIYFSIQAEVDVADGTPGQAASRLSLSLFSALSGSSQVVIPRAGEIVSSNGADSYFTSTTTSLLLNGTPNQNIGLVGNIPVSAVTNTRKYLGLSVTAIQINCDATRFNFSNVSVSLSLRGEPLNIGTFGQTSPIDSLDANIYEFDWGGGTTPEILDWGAVKMGKILQVSSPELVKTINPSSNVETITIPSKKGTTSARAKNYRTVVGNPEDQQFPPGSVNTSSVDGVHFWDTPQNVGDYYQILNGNNPLNHEISMFMYPNSTAGSDPTIPSTTKILTTEWGVPTKSNYALTSSNSDQYGSIDGGQSNRRFINLDRDVHISKVTTDNNGFYQSAAYPVKPNWATIGDQINKDLNEGEKWFVTLYNEFEFPNNQGDYNSVLTTGSLSPFNDGVSIDSRGNYSNALAYKGVYEIAGVYDNFGSGIGSFNILLYDEFPNFGSVKKIGGGTPGNSLGMLIWKARAAGKNEFVIVQDSVTGGVGPGAFTSRYVPNYITENFEEITKTYGANQTG